MIVAAVVMVAASTDQAQSAIFICLETYCDHTKSVTSILT